MLGLNIDHVATLRQARGTPYPDPLEFALAAQAAGAQQITVHLREDRRHIQDRDVILLKKHLSVPLNLETAATQEMVEFAIQLKPALVTLVPEKREEKTTEGGLDLHTLTQLPHFLKSFQKAQIPVSVFVEPSLEILDHVHNLAIPMAELHTGHYGNLTESGYTGTEQQKEALLAIERAAAHGHNKGLIIHAGHGLHYTNTQPIAQIPHIDDLNIGHSVVCRSLFVGVEKAVQEMLALCFFNKKNTV